MIYDVVIVGAGAAGLFAGINLSKKYKKLILEKNNKPGAKIILSGGERANISNIDIKPERDYFGQNKKFLFGVFAKYNNWDLQSFFAENGINIIEEDRGRLILESGNSRELLDFLLRKNIENQTEIKCNNDVKNITEKNGIFEIETEKNKKFKSKNIIISSGGKSFSQVGTTGEGYNFAKKFGLKIITLTKALGGLSTKKDLSKISGISIDTEIILFDKNNNKKIIYREYGPLLFTHFGISGPIVFNTGNALGEYLNKLKIVDFEKYIVENMQIKIDFEKTKNIAKRLKVFFDLEKNDEKNIYLDLQNFRSWKEAKATGGGVDLDELDKNFMSKKYKGLYFIGEVLDITGKTGGFNLQWAFSSAYICAKNIK